MVHLPEGRQENGKALLKDIIMIESLRDYVKVITTHQHIISYQKIGYLEERLPEKEFLRIHRSYIIARGSDPFL